VVSTTSDRARVRKQGERPIYFTDSSILKKRALQILALPHPIHKNVVPPGTCLERCTADSRM